MHRLWLRVGAMRLGCHLGHFGCSFRQRSASTTAPRSNADSDPSIRPPDPPPDGGHFEGVISIPVDEADSSFSGLGMVVMATLGVFAWAVPGALLAAPGLLLIVVILAQSMGALAWLPIVRRKIGGFGPTHRLTSPRGPA